MIAAVLAADRRGLPRPPLGAGPAPPWRVLSDGKSPVPVLIVWMLSVAVLAAAASLGLLTVAWRVDPASGNLAALVPPLAFLVLLFVARGTLRCLGMVGGAANIALCLVPLMPRLVMSFLPGSEPRIWLTALAAAVMLRLVVDRRRRLWCALGAGLVAGALASAPVGAAIGLATASGYAFIRLRQPGDPPLARFLAGMATGLLVAFLAIAPTPGNPLPCALAAGAALLAHAPLSRKARPAGLRAGALAALVALAFAGPLAANHLALLPPPDLAMAAWCALLGLGAAIVQARTRMAGEVARGWRMAAGLAGAALVAGLSDSAAAPVAQALLVPLLSAVLYDVLRVISRLHLAILRVPATIAALLFLSPLPAALATASALSPAGTAAPVR